MHFLFRLTVTCFVQEVAYVSNAVISYLDITLRLQMVFRITS